MVVMVFTFSPSVSEVFRWILTVFRVFVFGYVCEGF